MNKFLRQILIIAVCTITSTSLLTAYPPTTFYRPHDIDFRMFEWTHNNLRTGVSSEFGRTDECRDFDENKRNVLQLYNEKEASLAMLLGAPVGSNIDLLAKSLGVSSAIASSDSNRGKFILTGRFKGYDVTAFAKYKLPIKLIGTFELGLFVPIKNMDLYDISWKDQTLDVLVADKEFKDAVSSQLAAKATELGNLDINTGGWNKTGLGDAALILGWQKDFQQHKDYLKNVRINAKVGVSIPTGIKQEIDQSFSFPLGNDGAWGMPLGIGLDLDFVHNVRAGIEFDLLYLFDNTQTYRMKTSIYQSDFLLLHKSEATKSFGTTWHFNLFIQLKKLAKYFSGSINYQFLKKDEDTLSPKSYDFNRSIVNTAESLKEWSTQQFVFRANYDIFGVDAANKSVKPQLSFFYKLPIEGKRAIIAHTFGGMLSVNF